MRRRPALTLIVPLLFLALLLGSCSRPPTTLTSEQKLADFEYLWQVLHDEFPMFGVTERQYGVRWLENYDQYRQSVAESKHDLDFAEAMDRMLRDLHQGHTHLLSPNEYAAFVAMLSEPALREMHQVKVMNLVLQEPDVIERYQIWGKAVKVSTAPNLGAVIPKDNVITRIEVPDQVAYLRLASMAEYADDDARIADFLASISDYPYLIIDIRSNGGGSDLTWMKKIVAPLLQSPISYTSYKVLRGGDLAENYWGVQRNLLPIDVLPKAPCYPPEVFSDFRYAEKTEATIKPSGSGFGGEIYLLVNRGVFSASEGFACFAKCTGWATLVGQRTGGDGMGSTPILIKLPESGLLVRMRLEMTLNPNGSSNSEYGTAPDITVAPTEDSLSKTLELIQSR